MAAQNQVYPAGYAQQPGAPPPAVYPPPANPPGSYPPPSQQQTNATVVIAQPTVVHGTCTCGGSGYTEDFTLFGILCCLLCFPWGLICCLLMKERRCRGCGRRL